MLRKLRKTCALALAGIMTLSVAFTTPLIEVKAAGETDVTVTQADGKVTIGKKKWKY